MSNPDDKDPAPSPGADSIAEATWLHDPQTPFWKPTWGDILLHLGWRWLFLLPLIALIAGVVTLPFRSIWLQVLLVGGGKLLLLWLGLSITSAAYAIHTAIPSPTGPVFIL